MTGIKRITFSEQFRGMSQAPFRACGLGRQTVIFGRNGSGKTTFSEAIRSREAVVNFEWLDRVVGPTAPIFVFNRFYVQDALAEFVDGGGSAAAILKVGEVNVRLARREAEQVRTNDRNQRWLALVEAAVDAIEKSRLDAIQRMKTTVISVLGPRDEARFNSQVYTIRQIKAALQRPLMSTLTDEEFASSCEIIGLKDLGARITVKSAPEISARFLEQTAELVGYSPVVSAIDSLASNGALAHWVEQGLNLHEGLDRCLFCRDGVLSKHRLDELRGHFSDDLARFRVRLDQHMSASDALLERSGRWREELPAVGDFEPSLRAAARDELEKLLAAVDEQEGVLRRVEELLSSVRADPFASREAVQLGVPRIPTAALEELASRSNGALDTLSARKDEALRAVEGHLVSHEWSRYHRSIRREDRLRRLAARLEGALRRGLINARNLHAEQQDTTAMAAEIDADLRAHFGHAHLAVAATADSKGYVVQRNGEPARTLSEGERNAVALSYFLQSLHGADSDLARAVVVIDDPITSLDREAMFAAYALVEERTAGAGQLIVLTHDFEYFRLLLHGVSNRWGKSQKRISDGDESEIVFPAVSVLEARSVGVGATRVAELHGLPSVVVQRASEYHYLFWRIAQAIDGGDSNNLPILGNAARRLIEGFISFKAPHGNNFQEKVDHVRNAYRVDPVLARRVVKFLHGHSHREELRPTSAIDFPSVEAELRTAMEFIHSADSGHYRDMCKATSVENVFV